MGKSSEAGVVTEVMFRAGVNPSMGPADKTCDAMQSCSAASLGSPSLANPFVACDEPTFCTPRHMTLRAHFGSIRMAFNNIARTASLE